VHVTMNRCNLGALTGGGSEGVTAGEPLNIPKGHSDHLRTSAGVLCSAISADRNKNDKYDPPEGEHATMIAQMEPGRSIWYWCRLTSASTVAKL